MKYIYKFLIVIFSLCDFNSFAQNPTYSSAILTPTCSSCCNGSFTVTMSGCTAYTITTTPFLTPTFPSTNVAVYTNLCAGAYTIAINGNPPCGSTVGTVILTNSPCSGPMTFSINQTSATCSTCCNGSLTVTNIQNGCPAYTSSISPNATSAGFGNYTNLCAGTNYTVLVADAGCCGTSSAVCSMNFSTVTSILKENLFDGNVVISPNPSNGTFYIQLNNILNQNGSIIITDVNGKIVFNKTTTLDQSKLKIDAKLEEGLYFLNILGDNKKIIQTQKIIIYK